MFEAVFESDNGRTFVFGIRGSNYFAMNIGEAVNAAIGTSQGFAQIGETLENMAVGGRSIDVSGKLFGNIVERKNALRSVRQVGYPKENEERNLLSTFQNAWFEEGGRWKSVYCCR